SIETLRRALGTTSQGSSSTGSLSSTIWRLIREIPPNVRQVQNLATSGIVVRQADGDWLTRSIAVQSTDRLTVTEADGEGGNPTLDLATLPDSGVGTLQAITRDNYGRVEGTRAVVADDIPALDASKITTGEFADPRISQSSVVQHQ